MPLRAFIEVPHRNQAGQMVKGVVINPIKNYVRNYWIAPDPVSVTLAPQGTPGDTEELSFNVDSQGHFDWAYIVGSSDGIYSLEWFDSGTQRRLQNQPVVSSTIVGIGARPFRLPEPYFLNVGESSREVVCKIRNLTAANNEVRLTIYGRRFYHREAPPDIALDIAKKFVHVWRTFSYFLVAKETASDGSITPVGAGLSETFTFQSDSNADTDIMKLMVSSTGTFNFTLRERATNRLLMNDVITSTSGFGNAEFPFLLADTYLLERQKELLLEVTDTSGSPNTIFVTMAGRRLQYVG